MHNDSRWKYGFAFWAVAAASVALRADASGPLPPAAAGIIAQMDKEIVATKTKTIIALDKVLKDTTKKGDLEGAVAIKETLQQLRADVQAATGGRAVDARRGGATIVGRWTDGHNNVDIAADGSVKSAGNTAEWNMDGNTIQIKWSFGHIYRLSATPEGLTGVSVNASGTEVGKIKLRRVQ